MIALQTVAFRVAVCPRVRGESRWQLGKQGAPVILVSLWPIAVTIALGLPGCGCRRLGDNNIGGAFPSILPPDLSILCVQRNVARDVT
jgi:hypothetical protein